MLRGWFLTLSSGFLGSLWSRRAFRSLHRSGRVARKFEHRFDLIGDAAAATARLIRFVDQIMCGYPPRAGGRSLSERNIDCMHGQ